MFVRDPFVDGCGRYAVQLGDLTDVDCVANVSGFAGSFMPAPPLSVNPRAACAIRSDLAGVALHRESPA